MVENQPTPKGRGTKSANTQPRGVSVRYALTKSYRSCLSAFRTAGSRTNLANSWKTDRRPQCSENVSNHVVAS
jgi:hypothetical protein